MFSKRNAQAWSAASKNIDRDLEKKLIGMVGFRNIVVHQYQKIDYELVKEVLEQHADDLLEFARTLAAL